VVEYIARAGCGDLIRLTASCSNPREGRADVPHCGRCSQCIDRRFAVLAAGQEAADPARGYRLDLLTGERAEGHPRTMLAVYVETASRIAQMAPLQFFTRYGEVSRALRHIEGNPDGTAQKVFDLYQRHARQVSKVVDEALARYAAQIRRRELPASCLVRLVCETGSPVPDGGGHAASEKSRRMAENVFRRRGQVWEVRFNGGPDVILLPSKGAAYLHLLLAQPGNPLSAAEMAYRVARDPKRYALGDAGEVADREAMAAYRARYDELQEDLEEATTNNDAGAKAKIQEELASLTEQIRTAQGFGGRLRKASDDRERVRKKVGMAIGRVMKDITQYDRQLAEHLKPPRLICGKNPCYKPDREVCWDT
jgi:hypothetical protein